MERNEVSGSWVLVAADHFVISNKAWFDVVPRVFLRWEHFKGCSWVAFEENLVTWLRTFWWVEEFYNTLVCRLGAKDHTVRWNSDQFLWLKVADDNDHGSYHLFEGIVLSESTSNFSNLTISHINLLEVDFVSGWMNFARNDLAYFDITFAQIEDFFCLWWWAAFRSLNALLLLLFLFLWLFLFGGRWCLRLLFLLGLSLLLLLWLLLFFTTFFWGSRLSTLFALLLGFLLGLNLLQLFKFFELGFGWLSIIVVGETDEKTELLNLFVQAWKVLDMVNPSENIGLFKLLEIHQVPEIRSNLEEDHNISDGNVLSNNEHSHGQMFLQVFYQSFSLHSLGQFDH